MIGGALAGFGWWMLRRRTTVPALAETIKAHRPIPRVSMSIDAFLQVVLVGTGKLQEAGDECGEAGGLVDRGVELG